MRDLFLTQPFILFEPLVDGMMPAHWEKPSVLLSLLIQKLISPRNITTDPEIMFNQISEHPIPVQVDT